MCDDLMVAKTSFVAEVDGERITVRAKITHARASHPVVQRNPGLWKPVEVRFDVPAVETARANVSPPAPPATGRAAKKAAAAPGKD